MPAAARLAPGLIAASGLAALAGSLGSAGYGWFHALALAVTGTALWAAAGVAGGGQPLFGDVAARLPTARRRVAVRALVLATAPLAGLGVVLYAGAALHRTLSATAPEPRPVPLRTLLGTGLVGLSVVVAASAAGLAVGGDAVLWPALLIGAGLALYWGSADVVADEPADGPLEDRATRALLGAALVLAGAFVFLDQVASFVWDERTIAGVVAVLALGAIVILPRRLRTRRALAAEQRERERAEVAELLHDSVLQTLALIQRRPDTPEPVATLARRQERELRDWLLRGERAGQTATSFDPALRAVVAEIEDDHGVTVEAVVVGDARLSSRVEELVAATREALRNAAVHGGGAPIALFAKAEEDQLSVYVHDRGPGFDVAAIAPERRGVRDSIIGRMERVGGIAEIVTAAGEGCEVQLVLRRRDP